MAEVTLKKVVKAYGGNEVVHGIDLEVNSGEFVVFVGPSGCGKSTLLRMVDVKFRAYLAPWAQGCRKS